MSIELLRNLSGLYLILIAAIIVWLIIIFILHFFVPKPMLRAFFKEPYFSPFEVELFTGFPFAYIRTAMFMRLAGWPSSGKRRGLTEAYKLAPTWFIYTSRTLVSAILIMFSLLIIMSSALYYGIRSVKG